MRPQYLLSAFLLLALLLSGCARPEVKDEPPPKTIVGGGGGDKAKKRTPVGTKFDGVLRGRVVLDGSPQIELISAMEKHSDKVCCLMGASDMEKQNQLWIIGKDKGVANVVVWIQPLKTREECFNIPVEDRDRADEKFNRYIDQPHCAFIPHVQVAFPQYYDPETGKLAPSGEKFIVKNSAHCLHNTNWKGDPLKTGSGNRSLPPKTDLQIDLVPESGPIQIQCDIHPWMSAKIWAFDHPYAARTDDDGKFEIKNVPTGIDVNFFTWHEVPGFFNEGGKNGKKMQFKSGNNDLGDLKVPAK